MSQAIGTWTTLEEKIAAEKQAADDDFERIWGFKAQMQAAARKQATSEAGIEAEVAAGVPVALYAAVDDARRAADDAHKDVRAAEQRLQEHLNTKYSAADVPARAPILQRLQAERTDYQQLAAQADRRVEQAKAAVAQARDASWRRLGMAAEQEHARLAAHAGQEQRAAEEERTRRVVAAEQPALQAWERLQRLRVFRP